MTWIKICGITNVDDALKAVDAGANALGFVFYEKSPRRVDLQTTRKIIQALPQAIEKVGVFVNQDENSICAAADEAGLTAVQLHGDESESAYGGSRFGTPAGHKNHGRYFDGSEEAGGRRGEMEPGSGCTPSWWMPPTRRHMEAPARLLTGRRAGRA